MPTGQTFHHYTIPSDPEHFYLLKDWFAVLLYRINWGNDSGH